MSNNQGIPAVVLPSAPPEYDLKYMNQLLRAVELALSRMSAPGVVSASVVLVSGENRPSNINSPLNIKNIPTSSVGLNSGDVWNNAGVLTVV